MDSIAQRLRHVREASGIGPKALALTCKLGSSHIHMIETGDVEQPDLATLQKIADKTGVPVEWLAFGVGECPAAEVIAATAGAANDARRARMKARLGASPTASDFTGSIVDDDDTDDIATADTLRPSAPGAP